MKPHLQTQLAFSAHRPRVDKEDTSGSVHALRLAHALELNDGRNLRASLRPSELPPLTQGPIFCQTSLLVFFISCILFTFLLLYFGILKVQIKGFDCTFRLLFPHECSLQSVQRNSFPPAALLNKYFTEVKQFGVKLYRFLYFHSL